MIEFIIFTLILASMFLVASWNLSFIPLIFSYFGFFFIGIVWAIYKAITDTSTLAVLTKLHDEIEKESNHD